MAMQIPGFHEMLNASHWMRRKAIEARAQRMHEAWSNPTPTRACWDDRPVSCWLLGSFCMFLMGSFVALAYALTRLPLHGQWLFSALAVLSVWAMSYKLALLGLDRAARVRKTHRIFIFLGLIGLGCVGLLYAAMNQQFASALYRGTGLVCSMFLVVASLSSAFALFSGVACRFLHRQGIGVEVWPDNMSALMSFGKQSTENRDLLVNWLAMSPDGVPTTRMWCLVDQIQRPAHWWAPCLWLIHSGFVWWGDRDARVEQMRRIMEKELPGIGALVQARAQSVLLDGNTLPVSPSTSAKPRRI